MPTYEYICENCGSEFELFQSITARPLRKCRECGKSSLKRLIGAGAGVIFKGSGFYQTDYRSESYNNEAKKDKQSTKESATKKSKAKGESKKEVKAEKPSESKTKGKKKTA
ncbi:MAG: FmdB family zinc ribbon protein [Planctomycetota bacterium]|jgi:putative FmdB family regulatory protein